MEEDKGSGKVNGVGDFFKSNGTQNSHKSVTLAGASVSLQSSDNILGSFIPVSQNQRNVSKTATSQNIFIQSVKQQKLS